MDGGGWVVGGETALPISCSVHEKKEGAKTTRTVVAHDELERCHVMVCAIYFWESC